jgi:hypothetical protein
VVDLCPQFSFAIHATIGILDTMQKHHRSPALPSPVYHDSKGV